MYASVCDFVCIALLLPFVLGFCLPIFLLLFRFVLFCFVLVFLFCIVFSACYHWWICFLVSLLSSFFSFFLFLITF